MRECWAVLCAVVDAGFVCMYWAVLGTVNSRFLPLQGTPKMRLLPIFGHRAFALPPEEFTTARDNTEVAIHTKVEDE